jgi:positive regulator of sigma E activity
LLNEQCSLNSDKRKAIDEYLQRHTIANDPEYKKLWDMLPSPFPGLSLLELNPDLAKEWHPTKNGSLTPSDVTLHSKKKVWWKCNKNHEWQAVVDSRSIGRSCPYCSGKAVCDDNCLSTLNPDLAKQWHPTKNGSLTPSDVTLHSSKKVWWICGKGHEWEVLVSSRSAGDGCPYCSGRNACNENCLATLNPDLAKQWHPTKNGSLAPGDVTPHSPKKIWWICSKGHEWEATVGGRSYGTGCPKCWSIKRSKSA